MKFAVGVGSWKSAARLLGRKRGAGAGLEVRPTDRFLVSFPKSGNTWLRYMLTILIRGTSERPSLADMEAAVPDIHWRSNKWLSRSGGGRVLKSHQWFDPGYTQVAYVVRDPRPVAVSLFHHYRRTTGAGGMTLSAFVDEFLSKGGGFGTWREHVGSWLGARSGDPRFLLVRYEDLVADTGKNLLRICAHLNIAAEVTSIQAAVEAATIEKLRKAEVREGKNWEPNRQAAGPGAFFRKGSVDAWRDELPESAANKIREAWWETMEAVGYDD